MRCCEHWKWCDDCEPNERHKDLRKMTAELGAELAEVTARNSELEVSLQHSNAKLLHAESVMKRLGDALKQARNELDEANAHILRSKL